MREPPRLLDGELRPVERAILRSAEDDAPSAAAKAAAKAALGLDVGPPVPAPGPKLGWPVGALGALAAVGVVWMGVSLLSAEAPMPPPAPSVARAPAPPAAPPEAPGLDPLPADLFVGPAAPAPEPEVAPKPAPRRARREASPPSSRPESSLSEELRLLDRAREALANQESQAALRTLNRYRARFPSGVLAPEALVLRVEALAALDRPKSARRAFDRLRRERPSHPALPELRRLLEER